MTFRIITEADSYMIRIASFSYICHNLNKHDFPRTFIDSFDMLMRKNCETRETMSEKLNTTSKSLREWLMDPENRITIDFVVVIALLWKLPDWISLMLIDRACIHLNEFERRHQALDHILRVLWDKG